MAPSELPSTRAVRLASIHYGGVDLLRLGLVPVDGQPLPEPEAGAHIDLHLGNGLVRQYSLLLPQSSAQSYSVGIKRDAHSRGGSAWLHEAARVGQLLQISAPRNHFQLQADNGLQAPVVLLAGGIGITPIYAMLHSLQAQGRPWVLHYWGRAPEHMLFHDALAQLPNVQLHIQAGDAPAMSIEQVLQAESADSDVYACGPQSMLDALAALDSSQRRGRVHMERFAGAAIEPGLEAGRFEVELARTGLTVQIPADQTILEVLKAQDLDVMYSCEEGLCGACEVRCLQGQPLHLDSVRTPQEHQAAGTVIICRSRCRGERLVLDI